FRSRIGRGRVEPGAERPEQLVERWHAPAEVGRASQADTAAKRRDEPAANGRPPPGPRWIMLVAQHAAARDHRLEQTTLADPPVVDAHAGGQRDAADVSAGVAEQAGGDGFAALAPPPRRLAGDVGEKLARCAVSPPRGGPEAQGEAAGHGRP